MPRDHGRLLCRIWSDDDFKARSPEAQRMYMLLLSQRGLNHAGVIPVTLQRWSNCSAGTSQEDVLRALEELTRYWFVAVDFDTEELLVRSLIRNDGVVKQPNTFKAALRQAQELESPRLRSMLAAELRRLERTDADAVAAVLDPNPSGTPTEPQANPSVSPNAGPTDEPIGDPIPEPLETPSSQTRGKGKGVVDTEDSSSVGGSVEKRSSQAKRGTRIPDDFSPTPEMVAWARDRRPDLDGRLETEKFINYWSAKTGRDATKLDWVKTWKNWFLNARADPRQQHGNQTDANIAAFLGQSAQPTLYALPGGETA